MLFYPETSLTTITKEKYIPKTKNPKNIPKFHIIPPLKSKNSGHLYQNRFFQKKNPKHYPRTNTHTETQTNIVIKKKSGSNRCDCRIYFSCCKKVHSAHNTQIIGCGVLRASRTVPYVYQKKIRRENFPCVCENERQSERVRRALYVVVRR